MSGQGRKHQLLSSEEIQRRLEIWESYGRSAQQAAKEGGITRRAFDQFLDRYASELKAHDADGAPMLGRFSQTDVIDHGLPAKGTVARYVLTCAQNNTRPHAQFLENLIAFSEHIGAELKIARVTYNRDSWGGARKAGDDQRSKQKPTWHQSLLPYLDDDAERLAPELIWCGHLQILPTATNPLSGFQDYTGEASTIVPHNKVAMMPVATPRARPVKHLYSTGACTIKNYIQAKAGQKAEFHHTYGALLVEVMDNGAWFARQLVANERGTFCDFPYKVVGGQVTDHAEVAAIQWGDIHVANIDERIKKMFWGEGGVLDTLRPKKQLLHDLVDGESHNHHSRKDHHHQFELASQGKNIIRQEFEEARVFVDEYAHRPWCQSYVVWSNHDEFIRKYLQQNDYRHDHANAVFILGLELSAYQAIERGETPSLFRTALDTKTATVLVDDEGGLLVEGIVADYHGHVGAGGSRGSVQQYAKLGLKTMTGHSHAAFWINGATSAGTCTRLSLGYNKGPSAWSHTFTLVYRGGKRQQITANAELGLWRAPL